MTIETYPEMNEKIVDILRWDEAEVARLRAKLVSEHSLMIMYSDRDAATRRKLQEIGAVASHEEITNLDAIERLGRKLHDEQVRRSEWERMCEELGLVELEPAPDVLPCGHPREAMKSDGVTHWCTKCEGKNWRVRATISRLISNIPAACGVLREQGCVNLAGQLGRDYDNLMYWQEHGGLVEAKEKEKAR